MTADPAWREEWQLRDDFVPVGRYTSPAFFALEMERLWPRVWQIAGRVDACGAVDAMKNLKNLNRSFATWRIAAHSRGGQHQSKESHPE